MGVESSVEMICNKGCQTVRDDIAALEREELVQEVRGLTEAERRAVLMELKKIMAVYGDACQIPSNALGRQQR